MEGELRKIKKLYGEDFAKLCRKLFPRILDDEGRLLETLLANFAPSRSLYDDLIKQNRIYEFKGFIHNKAGVKNPEPRDIDKTPEELLKSAGYKLYRCKNNFDLRRFKKYYAPDEVLCTFRDQGRINRNVIFFAVREDVESIKREDFDKPEREDRYGTSVLSLQFDKEDGSLSIKNRYNHTVDNPDATYGNDLDCICPGLNDSFAKYYGLKSTIDYSKCDRLSLAHYIQGGDGRAYRVNSFVRGVSFCENNVVIKNDGTVIQYDKSRYELVDTFLIDKASKIIEDLSGNNDVFTKLFVDVDKIESENLDGGNRKIIVTKSDGTYFSIVIGKNSQMISYENKFQTEVENGFLQNHTMLESISIPMARKIGSNFLYSNLKITSIDLPSVEEVGDNFLSTSTDMSYISMPSLKKTGDFFMKNVSTVKSLHFPKLEETGKGFMCCSDKLEFFNAPELRKVGDSFLARTRNLRAIDLPSLEEVGNRFMCDSSKLRSVFFPNLRVIGDDFMADNLIIEKVYLPAAEVIGSKFLNKNKIAAYVNLPSVKLIGSYFMNANQALRTIELPAVEYIDQNFLCENKRLNSFVAPNLLRIGNYSLHYNKGIRQMNLPKIEHIGNSVLVNNRKLKTLNIPSARTIGRGFLTSRGKINKIRVSKRVVLPTCTKAKVIEEVGIKVLE